MRKAPRENGRLAQLVEHCVHITVGCQMKSDGCELEQVPLDGRVAQRESARVTCEKSLVRSQPRPPTPAIRVGKLNGSLVAVVQPAGANRSRYRISKSGERLYDLAQQIRSATAEYRYSATADKQATNVLYHRVRSAKRRADRMSWEFDLSLDWAVSLYNTQEGKCALTGLPFDTGPANAKSGRWRRPFRPSLDRIDSTKGYTQDNTRLICSCVNYALGAWGEGVLRVVAAALVSK